MQDLKAHPSYNQVLLDVNRCAGRLGGIRQVYLHRTDDDNEPPEDLTEELELQRLADESGELSNLESSENADESDGVNISNDEDSDGQVCHQRKKRKISRNDLHNQRQLKAKLVKLIVGLLIEKEGLHYYQGFHDVCLTYMTLLGDKEAHKSLSRLIDSHFYIFMQPTMNETQEYLALIPMIVGLHDSKAQEFLESAEVGTIFALSWVITWFSHVIPNQRVVEEIFRFLEEQDPHMVLYLSAAIVLHKKDKLLDLEPEMSTVHHFLCQVPRKEQLPIETLIERASEAFRRHPPEEVKRKLDDHRRSKLQVHNTNLIRSLAFKFGPAIANMVTNNTRTAIVVFVLASALALQIDRWAR